MKHGGIQEPNHTRQVKLCFLRLSFWAKLVYVTQVQTRQTLEKLTLKTSLARDCPSYFVIAWCDWKLKKPKDAFKAKALKEAKVLQNLAFGGTRRKQQQPYQVEQKILNLPLKPLRPPPLLLPLHPSTTQYEEWKEKEEPRSWWQITSQLPCRRLFFSPSWSWVRT